MMKDDRHTFKGMGRSTHQIRQDSSLLWDAYNINLEEHDGDTRFSITNDKKTVLYRDNTGYGEYVGHCIIGEHLIVFSKDYSNSIYKYYILRFDSALSRGAENNVVYSLTLPIILCKFQTIIHPENYWNTHIDAIGIIESDKIQKVYWVDGVNQPRVINVTKPELLGKNIETGKDYTNCYNGLPSLNFCPTINLKETISVKKEYGNGSFSPGVIQYAFSYYYLHGQETCIFNYTHLLYISYKDRGANSDEIVSNSFKITLENVDTNFDGIKVYSIQRTSIDGTPIVKLVGNIEINKNSSTYIFIDNGTKGESVDENLLLYLGGDSLIANTLTSKNNTLFLGNLKINNSDKEVSDIIDSLGKISTMLDVDSSNSINYADAQSAYNYNPKLDSYDANFKTKEYYRIGLQFQYSDGHWTSPYYLGTARIRMTYPWEDNVYNKVLTLDNSIISKLKALNIVRVRPCVVFPRLEERRILCQGILNPTVFNGKERATGNIYSMSSWFFRPYRYISSSSSKYQYYGTTVQSHHFYPIYANDKVGAEIQNVSSTKKDGENTSPVTGYSYEDVIGDYSSNFFVDSSLVTMHSPDIEFDNYLSTISSCTLNLVGYQVLEDGFGKYNIVSGPTVSNNTTGLTDVQINIDNSKFGDFGVLSASVYNNIALTSFPLYNDAAELSDFSSWSGNYSYIVYPWHRSGSLNNDTKRPDDKGAQTAVLKTKQLFNIRYFKAVAKQDQSWMLNIAPQYCSDNFVKVDLQFTSKKVTYLGNVDYLNTSKKEYSIKTGAINSTPTDIELENAIKTGSEPVRIKYKSPNHLVFSMANSNTMFTLDYGSAKTISLPRWMLGDNSESGKIENSYSYEVAYISTTTLEGSGSDGQAVLLYTKDYKPKSVRIINSKSWGGFSYARTGEQFRVLLNTSTYVNKEIAKKEGISELIDEHSKVKKPYIWTLVTHDDTFDIISKVEYKENSSTSGNTFYLSENPITPMSEYKGISLPLVELINRNIDEESLENSENYLQNLLWFPASEPKLLTDVDDSKNLNLEFKYGDTWYSRYNCLKTYPYTLEDENSVIEIGSFMCETRINLDAFTDRNRGNYPLFSASPDNFNTRNPVYEQKDNFFPNRILDKTLYETNKFPTQVVWSQEKHNASEVDEWTNISLASPLDLPGNKGELKALVTYKDNIFAFQERGISQILFNERVQIPTGDGVPIEITNGLKVQGYRELSNTIGCRTKLSICWSENALYFFDYNSLSLYRFSGNGFENIGQTKGVQWWINYCFDNQYNIDNTTLELYNDSFNNNIYMMHVSGNPEATASNVRSGLRFSEKLDTFISRVDGENVINIFNFGNTLYSLGKYLSLYRPFSSSDRNDTWAIEFISNSDPESVKIFDTVEVHADQFNTSNEIGGRANPSLNKLLNSHRDFSQYPFNKLTVSNEYQKASLSVFRNLREKFRTWRMQLPRAGRDRILNTWAKIRLENSKTLSRLSTGTVVTNNTYPIIIHDINVRYSV